MFKNKTKWQWWLFTANWLNLITTITCFIFWVICLVKLWGILCLGFNNYAWEFSNIPAYFLGLVLSGFQVKLNLIGDFLKGKYFDKD